MFYYGSHTSTLYCVGSTTDSWNVSRRDVTLSSTTLDIKIKKDGVYINDIFLPLAEWTDQSTNSGYAIKAQADVIDLEDIQVGNGEGSNHSNAEYKLLEVVHSSFDAPHFNVTYDLQNYIVQNINLLKSTPTRRYDGQSLELFAYPAYKCASTGVSCYMGGTLLDNVVNVHRTNNNSPISLGSIYVPDVTADISVVARAVELTAYEELSTDISSNDWQLVANADFDAGDVVEVVICLSTLWPNDISAIHCENSTECFASIG